MIIELLTKHYIESKGITKDLGRYMAAIPLPLDPGIRPCVQPCDLQVQGIHHGYIAFRSAHQDSRPGGIVRFLRADIVQRIVEFNDIISVNVPGLDCSNISLICFSFVIIQHLTAKNTKCSEQWGC